MLPPELGPLGDSGAQDAGSISCKRVSPLRSNPGVTPCPGGPNPPSRPANQSITNSTAGRGGGRQGVWGGVRARRLPSRPPGRQLPVEILPGALARPTRRCRAETLTADGAPARRWCSRRRTRVSPRRWRGLAGPRYAGSMTTCGSTELSVGGQAAAETMPANGRTCRSSRRRGCTRCWRGGTRAAACARSRLSSTCTQ